MTKKITRLRYAKNCHSQPNANAVDAFMRKDWSNSQSASSVDCKTQPTGSATSIYHYKEIIGTVSRKNKMVRSVADIPGKPWTFAGNDFDFDTNLIPECAYITQIKFIVPMKITGSAKINVPQARFNMYHGSKTVKDTIKNGTGWKDGYYYHRPSRNITNSWHNVEYVMSGEEFRKRGYPVKELYENRLGIDLRWQDGTKISDNTVSIKYIACEVTFELPDQKVTFEKITTEDNPDLQTAGNSYRVLAHYYNNSNAGCCNGTERRIKVTPPPNATIERVLGVFDSSTNEWVVECKPNGYNALVLEVTDYGVGEHTINYYNPDIGNYNYWVYSSPQKADVGRVSANPHVIQKGVQSCIEFNSMVNASDGEATFNINMDRINGSTPSVNWSLCDDTDTGVSIDDSQTTDSKVVLTVPRDEVVNVRFKGCFLPSFTGASEVYVDLDGDDEHADVKPYNSLPTPTFVIRNNPKTEKDNRDEFEIGLNPSVIKVVTHRIATTTELGAYVIDCGVADNDGEMIEEDCTLAMDYWEKVDYIGCVPLKYHHYDPDSTYSNKAISEAYKNKVYKGKTGEIEESISLKFKARPKQVPTLQGLVKMDKPTPINANHKCFEGDPLNHRGWAVLSEIKATRTNPLWYDCEAEVDYITHDITTKFQIYKGNPVNNITMPELLLDTVELGENLSDALDILDIQTDGGFIYDEDGDDGAKNLFNLDEGETLSIKTRQALSNVSHIRFDWYSNRNSEFKENVISRVFRLRDADGNSVFEYEYTDFVFEDDYVTCTVIKRVKNAFGSWDEQVITDVDLRTDLEADPKADEEEEEIIEAEVIDENDEDTDPEGEDDDTETAYEEGYIAPEFNKNDYDLLLIYGSSLEFVLKGNILNIYDAGFNGREVTLENEVLQQSNYTFETVWTNQNVDGTTEDIVSYIDIELSETILQTQYEQTYKNLYVSPFPIPYKTVVFTRESEEGTIFYLTGAEPFKYLLEPYYQYYCGCDLLGEGIEIFDLNNSYSHYYIENGLVRFGFNKHTGRLYLAKYDIVSKEWITTHHFHMVNEPKFSIDSYSDDKIVVKAGTDTLFTIWRGHPYIGINNPSDVIYIDDKFHYCLTDKVNGMEQPYPTVYSFMNDSNLLPNGIGGELLDYDLIMVDEDDTTITSDTTVTFTPPVDVVADNEVTLQATVTSQRPTNGKAHFFVNGVEVGSAESPFSLTYTFPEKGEYEVFVIYTATDDNVAMSEKITVSVANAEFSQETEPLPEIPGKYDLKIISAPSKFTYMDGEEVIVQVTKNGEGVKGVPIELQTPKGNTITDDKGTKGIYRIKNNDTDFIPGNYQWGARLWDNGKLIAKALRWIKIEKVKPTFTHNDEDGKVKKGKNLTIKLNNVYSMKDPTKKGLANKKVTYTISGDTKKSATTDDNGKFKVKFNTTGTKTLKCMFAGSTRYDKSTKKFTIKVVK